LSGGRCFPSHHGVAWGVTLGVPFTHRTPFCPPARPPAPRVLLVAVVVAAAVIGTFDPRLATSLHRLLPKRAVAATPSTSPITSSPLSFFDPSILLSVSPFEIGPSGLLSNSARHHSFVVIVVVIASSPPRAQGRTTITRRRRNDQIRSDQTITGGKQRLEDRSP
jgi:hypothetical protein